VLQQVFSLFIFVMCQLIEFIYGLELMGHSVCECRPNAEVFLDKYGLKLWTGLNRLSLTSLVKLLRLLYTAFLVCDL
jgi:hypothetical protein